MIIANGPLSTSDRHNLTHLEHVLPDLLSSEDTFWEGIQVQIFDPRLSSAVSSHLSTTHNCIVSIETKPLALGFRMKQNILDV